MKENKRLNKMLDVSTKEAKRIGEVDSNFILPPVLPIKELRSIHASPKPLNKLERIAKGV